jgi:sortase (surface protein transpeptidase)
LRRWRIGLAAGVVLLVAGGVIALLAPRSHRPPSLPRLAGTAAPAVTPPASPSAAQVARTVPAQLIIPAIGVNASVVPEGTDSTGALEVPPLGAVNLTGWWDGGAAPGQDGPAVIVGHVDSVAAGPLVFWHLSELKPGDLVETEPGNLQFAVTSLQEVSKNAFPTQQVYGPTPGPQLRLITCGGAFDAASGSYVDNVIVYATEVQAASTSTPSSPTVRQHGGPG